MTQIAYIIGELNGMSQGCGDIEACHSRADALLVETIRELQRMPSYYTDREIEELIAAYVAVPKWFA